MLHSFSVIDSVLDQVQRGFRLIQRQQAFEQLSVADSLLVILVLVAVCWGLSVSVRSVRQR